MSHCFTLRVYYEDTDLAGIVYYANYLKFIERARTEWVRELGVDQRAMKEGAGLVFAVRRVEADYLAPALHDDVLMVESSVSSARRAQITLRQEVRRGDELLFSALVSIVCLDAQGRPRRMPEALAPMVAAGRG
ncbi:MAG: tol-pal system-associated acyl-CoA thioesterase [Pararhodobacter sp.]|nr:tol-pal system-associated acyl-CoA thioesterase [Pararhodobacter sp.]